VRTFVEGPAYGPLVRTLISRLFLLSSPIYVALGSYASFVATHAPVDERYDAFQMVGLTYAFALGSVLVTLLVVPDLFARARRRHHARFIQWTEATDVREELAWSGCLLGLRLGESVRHRGSLHVARCRLSFLAPHPILSFDLTQEIVLELDLHQVAAIEVRPARGFLDWLFAGPGLVAILLRDGCEMLVATSDAERLAVELRKLTHVAELSPIAAPPPGLPPAARGGGVSAA
jgi:hypothetical protein